MKKVDLQEAVLKDALLQIELLDNIDLKNLSSIRLLTEEIYSMFYELLDKEKLNFSLDSDGNNVAITVSVRAWTDEETKQQFISMNSSGKNDAYKGVKGFFKYVVDSLLIGASVSPSYSEDMDGGFFDYEGDYSRMYRWKLSEYAKKTPVEKVKTKWDELEKSIIMNFADDISIAIRNDCIEMIVVKEL